MTRIRVVVTAEDIANGNPKVSDACPVAHALHRAGYPRARVYPAPDARGFWMPLAMSGDSIRLSKPVNEFGLRFDGGKPVQPATFYLEGPDR